MPINKNILRQTLRKKRRELDSATRNRMIQQINTTLSTLPAFQNSQHIAFYLATDGEVDLTDLMIIAKNQRKNCYLPILFQKNENDRLVFYSYQPGDALVINKYQIGEPDRITQREIDIQALELVIAPLVAFDSCCHRLGRGAGYYDRTFEFLIGANEKKPFLLGVAYDFQKATAIEPASWDVPMNMIVTERKVYERSSEY